MNSMCLRMRKEGAGLFCSQLASCICVKPRSWLASVNSGSMAEELADAKLPPKAEVLAIIESLTLSFLESLAKGEDPSLHLVYN